MGSGAFSFYSAFSIPQSAMLLALRLLPIGNHAVEGDCQHLLLGMVGEDLHLSPDRAQLAVPLGSEDQAILLAVLDRSEFWGDICRRTLYLQHVHRLSRAAFDADLLRLAF